MKSLIKIKLRISNLINTIGRTIEIAAALVAILAAAGLGSVVTGFLTKITPILVLGIIVTVASLVLLIIIFSLLEQDRIKRNIKASQQPLKGDPPNDLVVLRKEITYKYSKNGPESLIKFYKLCATKDGAHSFLDRYLWTGTGVCVVESLTPGFRITNKHREEFWHFFDVHFDTILKGDVIEFELKWNLEDVKGTSVPFLSAMVDIPMDFMSMRVILPEPSVAYFYSFDSYIDNLPSSRELLRFDMATKSFYREISQPSINQKFLIKWLDE